MHPWPGGTCSVTSGRAPTLGPNHGHDRAWPFIKGRGAPSGGVALQGRTRRRICSLERSPLIGRPSCGPACLNVDIRSQVVRSCGPGHRDLRFEPARVQAAWRWRNRLQLAAGPLGGPIQVCLYLGPCCHPRLANPPTTGTGDVRHATSNTPPPDAARVPGRAGCDHGHRRWTVRRC